MLASLLAVMKLLLLAVGLSEWLLSRALAPEHWLHLVAGPEWLLSRALTPELLLYWLHLAAGPEWLLSRALVPELLLYESG